MMPWLESGVRPTAESVGRDLRMKVLHSAMKDLVGALQTFDLKGLSVRTIELVE